MRYLGCPSAVLFDKGKTKTWSLGEEDLDWLFWHQTQVHFNGRQVKCVRDLNVADLRLPEMTITDTTKGAGSHGAKLIVLA